MTIPPITTDSPADDDDAARPQSFDVDGTLATLRPLLDARIEATVQLTQKAIMEHPATLAVAGTGQEMRALVQQFTATTEATLRRDDLYRSERETEVAKIAAARDAAIDALESKLTGDRTAAVARAFPAPALPIAPGTKDAIDLVRGGFATNLPADFEADALTTLRTAMTSTDPNAAYLANQLLQVAYSPLMRRRATAPEGFAADRVQSAAAISRAIDHHLHLVTGGVQHHTARELAARAGRSFGFLRSTLKSTGGKWDAVVMESSTPDFIW